MNASDTARKNAEALRLGREWSDRGPNPDCQCMATGCKKPLNPAFIFCLDHLKMVPESLRRQVQHAAFNQQAPTPELLALVGQAREAIREATAKAEKGAKK